MGLKPARTDPVDDRPQVGIHSAEMPHGGRPAAPRAGRSRSLRSVSITACRPGLVRCHFSMRAGCIPEPAGSIPTGNLFQILPDEVDLCFDLEVDPKS